MLRNRSLLIVLLGSLFVLLSIVDRADRPHPAYAQQSRPGSQVITSGTTNTAFTYQGRLLDNGQPRDGIPCRFVFGLWDAEIGGNLLGVSEKVITPKDGFFTAEVDFGQDVFTGDSRWMSIKVRCPDPQGSWVDLHGRIALRPVPYALGLRPGARVEGEEPLVALFSAVNRATSGSGAALYGESMAPGSAGVAGWSTASGGGYGVYGNNTAGTGTPYGVYGIASDNGNATSYGVFGQSNSSSGVGVGGQAPWVGLYGNATATQGSTYGVYAQSQSPAGYGVFARVTADYGDNAGVYGETSSASNDASGVFGKATASNGATIGVRGESASPQGTGVYGNATSPRGRTYGVYGNSRSPNGAGVYGGNSSTAGVAYGVYGESLSPHGYGVYSKGNAHVEGDLTWKPKVSYLSLPANAFRPRRNGYEFENHLDEGSLTFKAISVEGSCLESHLHMLAPVYLPHGARIKEIRYTVKLTYSRDGSLPLDPKWARGCVKPPFGINLVRTDFSTGTTTVVGYVPQDRTIYEGDLETFVTPDEELVYSQVDNSRYAYFLDWYSWGRDVVTLHLYGAVITYEVTEPH